MLSAVRLVRRSFMDLRHITTATGISGYQQANVVILPSKLADDFEAFCHANPAPLPLIYRSQSGQTSCPPLASDADIRSDVSQYCVYEGGRLVKTISSLLSYSQAGRGAWPKQEGVGPEQEGAGPEQEGAWSDMVCFYLGCSFGFEGMLTRAGVPVRNIEQRRNISMYKTAVPCVAVGPFCCPLVVTMRPVPVGLLDTVTQTTHRNLLSHGAPVHIGDPALLGIQDLSKPDYGDPVEAEPGDVTVFWACGVTAIEAVLSSKPSLAFSHSPGCMFLTDIPESAPSSLTPPPAHSAPPPSAPPPSDPSAPPPSDPGLTPLCFLVSQNPLHYSLASERAVRKIRELERIIGEDPGERGIKALFVQDELLRSCLALSHSSSVAITTGFPTHYMHSPPDETDGPPGAIAMATMLLSLGKQVTMITDHRALEMNQAIIKKAVETGVLKAEIPLVTFSNTGPDSALQFLCHHGDPNKPRFDQLVAVERSGRASDGNYYNMRGINIKHLVDPVDDLFIAAQSIAGVNTIGVGDGGNELGMGKVREKVKTMMPAGELIACDVSADYAITAGVSNWGAYAVACGLYLLNTCPSHQRYLRKGLGLEPTTSPAQLQDWTANLPSVEKEECILSILVDFGVRSGKTGNLGMEVDGLTFHPTHSDIITRLLKATLSPAP